MACFCYSTMAAKTDYWGEYWPASLIAPALHGSNILRGPRNQPKPPMGNKKVCTDVTHVRLQTEDNESDFDLPHSAADPHIVVNCRWTWTFHLEFATLIREMTYQLVSHRSF